MTLRLSAPNGAARDRASFWHDDERLEELERY